MIKAMSEINKIDPKIERIAKILRFASWGSLWLQLVLGAASILMLIVAISGRQFTRETLDTSSRLKVNNYTQATTPGLGISIFWGVCGIIVLLFAIYLAFRLTRFARRLRNLNPKIQPKKSEVMQALRIGIMTGLVGMLLTIFGCASGLGVLLTKSIAQPQGVAIYNPNRIIRALDIFVAAASMSGISAHFIGTVTSLGLFNWLHSND